MKSATRVLVDNIIGRSAAIRMGVVLSLVLFMAPTLFVSDALAGRVFPLEIKNLSDTTIIVIVGAETSCMDSPRPTQAWKIKPGKSETIPGVARRQGHGCDGKQGTFEIEVTYLEYDFEAEIQKFEIDNGGTLQKRGKPVNYASQIDRSQAGGWTWTIGEPQ